MEDDYIDSLRYALDREETEVVLRCDKCGAEIYKGNEFYCDDFFRNLCEDCLDDYFLDLKKQWTLIAGEEDEY